MKHVVAILCIVFIAYLYRSNTNDIKALVDPKNICPPKTRIRAPKPAALEGKTMTRQQEMVEQQVMLNYKAEEKKALEKDRLAREKMFKEMGKPCHEKQPKKQGTPADLLDNILHGWGWY